MEQLKTLHFQSKLLFLTNLIDHLSNSVDIVTAATAFHWFDIPKTRQECIRILKKSGRSHSYLVLIR